MEQIVIRKPNGETYSLTSRKEVRVLKAEQRIALLGEDVLDLSIKTSAELPLEIGDYTVVFGRKYKINRLPEPDLTSETSSSIELEMEGIQYDLARATYDLTINTTNNELQDVQADSLTGDLKKFAEVLIANANRVFVNEWQLGDCPNCEITDKTLTFGEESNCLSVLQLLCSEFGTECEIEQRENVNILHFRKIGTVYPFTFQYGRGRGLYELRRKNQSSANIITRLKVFGSSRNITSRYRAARLCLPGKSKGESYIENSEAVERYGVWEATKKFNDIYPSRTGEVEAIDANNVLKFSDSTMFNLNALEEDGETTRYLIPGSEAKIRFISGNLSGYEFSIAEYDHDSHTFALKKFKDDRGDVFPSPTSEAFRFSEGDKYKLLNIALPKIYEDSAESELESAGVEYYQQNSQPKVSYDLAITPSFLERRASEGLTTNVFLPGDYIRVEEPRIGVDKNIRIKSIVRNLKDVYSYDLTLSDMPVKVSLPAKIISELQKIDNLIELNRLEDPIRARQNWRNSQEVLNMIFDPEGNYFTDRIKPKSIETIMLSVGATSMQFALLDTVINANANSDKNEIGVKGGVLAHYAIEESIRSWNISDSTTFLAQDNKAYYIYAKCEKEGDSAIIIFSENQILTEEDPNYYHFFIGVVNSVNSDLQARSLSLSYGFSTINGGFITTGCLKSSNKALIVDLDNARIVAQDGAEIIGNITFKSGESDVNLADWAGITEQNVQNAQKKAEQAAAQAEANVAETNAKIAALQAQVDGEVSNWYYKYTPTLSNYPASSWETNAEKDKHIGDTFTNIQQAPATNAGKSWRFIKNGSSYQWSPIADSDAVLALQRASQAQSTADGKSTTYLTQPTSYQMGDMWSLNAARTVDGVTYKKGELLTAKQDSNTFVEAHWYKRVPYTDDSAVEALQVSSENLFKYSSLNPVRLIGDSQTIGEGFEKIFKADNPNGWAILPISNPTPLCKKGEKVTISFEYRHNQAGAFKFELTVTSGTNHTIHGPKNLPENNTDEWKAFTETTIADYADDRPFGGLNLWGVGEVRRITIVRGDKFTGLFPASADTQAEIGEAKQAASAAQESVVNLNSYIDGSFSDNLISTSERIAISKYKNTVNESMNKAQASYLRVYQDEHLEGAVKTLLLNSKVSLFGAKDELLEAIEAAIADGKTTEEEAANVDAKFLIFNSAISEFQAALESAKQSIYKKIKEVGESYANEKVDEMVIQHRNLFALSKMSSYYAYNSQQILDIGKGKVKFTFKNNSSLKRIAVASNGFIPDTSKDYVYTGRLLVDGIPAKKIDFLDGMLSTYGGPPSYFEVDDDGNFEMRVKGFNRDWLLHCRFNAENYVVFENLKFQEGSKFTGWSPAPEDVQADIGKKHQETAHIRAALKEDTEINGGLLLASLLGAKDADGKVRSYISGNPSGNPIAVAAGVSNFGTDAEVQNVAIKHDGTAKVGIFSIDSEGNVRILNETKEERIGFYRGEIDSLDSLLNATTSETTKVQESVLHTYSSGTLVVPGTSIEVSENGGYFNIRGKLKLEVNFNDYERIEDPYDSGEDEIPADETAEGVLALYKDGVRFKDLCAVHYESRNDTNAFLECNFNEEHIYIDKASSHYELRVIFSLNCNLATSDGNLTFSEGRITWILNRTAFKKIAYGTNGLIMTYPGILFYLSEEDGLTVKGKTNLPGVLCTGSSNKWGVQSNYWGAYEEGNVEKMSQGHYRVYHNIGHGTYTATFTPHYIDGATGLQIGIRTAIYVEVYFYRGTNLRDTGFDYMIYGTNF